MQVTAGSRLGPYEIVAPIGAGGMGEVYKARDTRLDRSVAIKVLPAAFADNAQLKIRFEREAKTISQLTHPHICTLYDVGNEGGVEYLVMELLEGDTLADRLARGPLPMRDVLRYGREIAAALDRAHRAGVVHRDLKPGNVMITKSGAKLLDFGLAKGGTIQISSDDLTQQKSLTQEGTILGTFQYMAPEQLEGIEADARTDIFALGAVLYEMATGRRAFDGKTKTSLIAAIVGGEPKAIREFQPLTPAAFEHVIAKCLAKDPDQRWQSASDVASELEWIGGATSIEAGAGHKTRRDRWRLGMTASVLFALLLVALALASWRLVRHSAADAPTVMSLTMPAHDGDVFGHAAFSPDGSLIALIMDSGSNAAGGKSTRTLWIRQLDRFEPRELPGTDGALHPFWSPDGKSVGFFAQGKLKRIAIAGGPPQVICDAPLAWGGSWNRDGVIIFCSQGVGPLFRVDANGGTPRAVTKLAPREEAHRWPVFLPDGDHFIFQGDAYHTEDHHIKVGSLRDGSSRDLFQGVTNATYVEPGELLFVRSGALLAQAFDAKTLALSGEPRVVAEKVVENDENHSYEFAASSNGKLIYRSGRTESQLTWVDRFGRVAGTVGDPNRMGVSFRLSPDQQRVIVDETDADGRADDLWIFNVSRPLATRFTFDPAGEFGGLWSADGSKIAFTSMRSGMGDLYQADAGTPTNIKRITSVADQLAPTSWTRDGAWIMADRYLKADTDVWMFPTSGGAARPYLSTPFAEGSAELSPDNSLVAYASDESGHTEVYVEQFPTHAGRRQVSAAGGTVPRWRSDGKELFYISRNRSVMSVDMTSETATPFALFQLPGSVYEVTRDGQRFLVDKPLDDNYRSPLTFVSNWLAERN